MPQKPIGIKEARQGSRSSWKSQEGRQEKGDRADILHERGDGSHESRGEGAKLPFVVPGHADDDQRDTVHQSCRLVPPPTTMTPIRAKTALLENPEESLFHLEQPEPGEDKHDPESHDVHPQPFGREKDNGRYQNDEYQEHLANTGVSP